MKKKSKRNKGKLVGEAIAELEMIHNGQVSESTKKRMVQDNIAVKYADCDKLYIEIDSHLASGLTLEDIQKCIDCSDNCGDFIKCLEGKRYKIN